VSLTIHRQTHIRRTPLLCVVRQINRREKRETDREAVRQAGQVAFYLCGCCLLLLLQAGHVLKSKTKESSFVSFIKGRKKNGARARGGERDRKREILSFRGCRPSSSLERVKTRKE
jgi:hypothetical protein